MRVLAFFTLLAGLVITACAAPQAVPAGPVVETSNGLLEGVETGGIHVFKGIPFAAPPTGENRWRAPQPARNWDGVRSAASYGDACLQPPGMSAENGGDVGPVSEDCLYLNVWTPDLAPEEKRPVLVWIHGGAYVFGGGSVAGYSGERLADQGLVVVNLNYRLGALGFFAHPALEGEPGTVANFGLMDQIAALHWVQDNIAAFGGDPDNVTIAGQSAGAKSVLALYASPLATGLFDRGIAMSAYVLPEAGREKAQTVAANIATAVGLDGAQATASQLRSIPGEAFISIEDRDASLGPVAIAGDLVLPQSIANAFEAGAQKQLPLIIGSTSDDASVISAFGIEPASLIDKLGAAGIGLRLLYPGMSKDERARQALRDAVFTLTPRWIAEHHSEIAPTWRYYFDYVSPADREALPGGAPHGYEVAFFLDTVPLTDGLRDRYRQEDLAVSQDVSGLIVAFAGTGEPGGDWPDHTQDRDLALVMSNEEIEVKRGFMRVRLNTFLRIARMIERSTAEE